MESWFENKLNNIALSWISSIQHVNKPFSDKLLLFAVKHILDIMLSVKYIKTID